MSAKQGEMSTRSSPRFVQKLESDGIIVRLFLGAASGTYRLGLWPPTPSKEKIYASVPNCRHSIRGSNTGGGSYEMLQEQCPYPPGSNPCSGNRSRIRRDAGDAQSKGLVKRTMLNQIGKPWLGLTLRFCESRNAVRGAGVVTDDRGKSRVELPAGTYCSSPRLQLTVNSDLPSLLLLNIQTPGDVNLCTSSALHNPRCRNMLELESRLISQVKKSREQIEKFQAGLDQAGDRAIEELRSALRTPSSAAIALFQRWGDTANLATSTTRWGNLAAAGCLSTSRKLGAMLSPSANLTTIWRRCWKV